MMCLPAGARPHAAASCELAVGYGRDHWRSHMWSRRRFLEVVSGLPVVGGIVGARAVPAGAAAPRMTGRDYFRELGVRPFINAAGTYTAMTASLMPSEVMDAINYASKHYVMLDELHDKVGERIATLVHSEAAMVTSGAASALTLGTAAVLTGTDRQKIVDLPNLATMKSEVITQKSHRFGYEHAVRNCGVKLVEVETREELERAINERTALMLFYNAMNREGRIPDEEFAQLGRKHAVPTFNDAAADVPPVDNFWKYTRMGFDLVAFSGGKGIRGPQSAGLLLGRKGLIEAARLHAPPNGNTVGRGMKVNKEEMLAMLVALELFLEKDHARDRGLDDATRRGRGGRPASAPGPGEEGLTSEPVQEVQVCSRHGRPRVVANLPGLLERHRLPGPQRLVGPVQLELEQLRLPAAPRGSIDLHERLLGVEVLFAEGLRPLQKKLVTPEVGDLCLHRPQGCVRGARRPPGSRLHAGRRHEEATHQEVRVGGRLVPGPLDPLDPVRGEPHVGPAVGPDARVGIEAPGHGGRPDVGGGRADPHPPRPDQLHFELPQQPRDRARGRLEAGRRAGPPAHHVARRLVERVRRPRRLRLPPVGVQFLLRPPRRLCSDPVDVAIPGLERRAQIGDREGLLPEAGIRIEQVLSPVGAQLDDAAAETRHDAQRQGGVRQTKQGRRG